MMMPRRLSVIAVLSLVLGAAVAPLGASPRVDRGNRGARDVRPGDVLVVELMSPLSTKDNREGDRFTARVVEPDSLADAYVEGSVRAVRRSGRVKGDAEIELEFDRLVLSSNREYPLSAQIEAVDLKDSEVDSEGHVRRKGGEKKDALIIAGGAGIGAGIGAAIGGKKGAAIGAAVGSAIGATTVLTTRGPELDFPEGTRMTIRVLQ